jgi:hypothetical protein
MQAQSGEDFEVGKQSDEPPYESDSPSDEDERRVQEQDSVEGLRRERGYVACAMISVGI